MWMLTPPLAGRRTPCPGPVRVLVLPGGVGRAGLPGAFWPPGWGKAPQRRESRPEHREQPDQTRRGSPARGHQARQRGTPAATTTPERGAGARPAPPPQPLATTGTAGNKRARPNAPGCRTDRVQRRRASTNGSGRGATPQMTKTTPVTPVLLPAQGRQRDGMRQSEPRPYWLPRPHKQGAQRTGRPPPLPAPRHTNATNPPHRGRTAQSQVGGNRDQTAPPEHARRSKGPGRDTRRGTDDVQRPYQRPMPGLREVRTPHHPGRGGADAAGA